MNNTKTSQDPYEYVFCGLCGADDPKLLFGEDQIPGGKTGGMVRCRACGLIYRNIRQKETCLRQNYAQWYEEGLAPESVSGRKELFAKCLKLAEPFRQRNRILDVGAGHGFFLSECAKRGWDCYGVEFSRTAVDFAQRNFGLNLFCGAFEETEYPSDSFDAVTFFNSLEFMPNPKRALQKTCQLLRPGGAIIVRFSNAGFHVAAYRFFLFLGKVHWKLCRLDLPVIHLYAFDRRSITRLLLESGFSGINVSCMPLNWLNKNDVQTGFTKQLSSRLMYWLALFLSRTSCGHLMISPSLVATAQKRTDAGSC